MFWMKQETHQLQKTSKLKRMLVSAMSCTKNDQSSVRSQ
jgi:hypothetical protein